MCHFETLPKRCRNVAESVKQNGTAMHTFCTTSWGNAGGSASGSKVGSIRSMASTTSREGAGYWLQRFGGGRAASGEYAAWGETILFTTHDSVSKILYHDHNKQKKHKQFCLTQT